MRNIGYKRIAKRPRLDQLVNYHPLHQLNGASILFRPWTGLETGDYRPQNKRESLTIFHCSQQPLSIMSHSTSSTPLQDSRNVREVSTFTPNILQVYEIIPSHRRHNTYCKAGGIPFSGSAPFMSGRLHHYYEVVLLQTGRKMPWHTIIGPFTLAVGEK